MISSWLSLDHINWIASVDIRMNEQQDNILRKILDLYSHFHSRKQDFARTCRFLRAFLSCVKKVELC